MINYAKIRRRYCTVKSSFIDSRVVASTESWASPETLVSLYAKIHADKGWFCGVRLRDGLIHCVSVGIVTEASLLLPVHAASQIAFNLDMLSRQIQPLVFFGGAGRFGLYLIIYPSFLFGLCGWMTFI